MRILQIVSHGVGGEGQRGVGGPEKRALESLKRLDRERFEPVIVYSSAGVLHNQFKQAGVRVIDFCVRGIEHVGAARFLAGIIRREGINLVHTQGPLAADFYAARACRMASVPFIVTRPSLIEDYRCSWLRTWAYSVADRGTLRTAARIVAVSEDGRRRMAALLAGIRQDKIVLIRNGVDVDGYHPDPDARSRLLSEIGGVRASGEWAPMIGMAAQVVQDKGWDDFLRVARRVVEEFPEALAFVIGSGPLLPGLKDQARRMEIGRSVRFLGFRRDVEKLLPALDVVLLTSRREGLPVSLIESMACGRPVVTTDAGGSAELVTQGETGYVVRVGDWQSAAEHVIELLGNRAALARMGAEARRLAVAEYSLERMVCEYQTIYEAVAGLLSPESDWGEAG